MHNGAVYASIRVEEMVIVMIKKKPTRSDLSACTDPRQSNASILLPMLKPGY